MPNNFIYNQITQNIHFFSNNKVDWIKNKKKEPSFRSLTLCGFDQSQVNGTKIWPSDRAFLNLNKIKLEPRIAALRRYKNKTDLII